MIFLNRNEIHTRKMVCYTYHRYVIHTKKRYARCKLLSHTNFGVNFILSFLQCNTLDLVITNEEHMVNEILYQPRLGLSDHVCLNFNYLCYVEKSDRPIPRFNLYRADFNQLNNLLHSVAWEEALRDLDVDSAWGYFSGLFNTFMEECIPMSVPKRRKNLYITREAKFLKNRRNRLWRIYVTSKSHSDYLAYIVMPCVLSHATYVNNLRDRLPITLRKIPKHSGVMQETE